MRYSPWSKSDITWVADSLLGADIAPNLHGAYNAWGDMIPVVTDSQRLRICPSFNRKDFSGDILALGDSWTEGVFWAAESNYVAVTGERLNLYPLNGGKSGAGLAQMVAIGRRVIPIYRPKYVVAAYRRSLVESAMEDFSASVAVRPIPAPYFGCSASGDVELEAPVYGQIYYNYPRSAFRHRSFKYVFVKLSLPVCIHDDIAYVGFRLRKVIGTVKPPCKDFDKVFTAGYRDLNRVCKENGSKLIILVFHEDAQAAVSDSIRVSGIGDDVLVVNGTARLYSGLDSDDINKYLQTYAIWKGDPPQMVNEHPNTYAYCVLGEYLADRIQEWEQNRGVKAGSATGDIR